MSQEEIVVHALLEGIKQTSKERGITKEMILYWMRSSDFQSKFFRRLKSQIVRSGLTEGVQRTAELFGLSELMVSDLLKKHFSDQSGVSYPFDTSDKFAQVFIQPKCTWKTSSSQTEGSQPRPIKEIEDKRVMKQYTIKEKIEAIKKCSRHTSQAAASRGMNIPTASIIRWRDRIKYVAFQDGHYDAIYADNRTSKRDSILNELDFWLCSWINRHRAEIANLDEQIALKAKKIVKIDEQEPHISMKWLNAFKAHFNI